MAHHSTSVRLLVGLARASQTAYVQKGMFALTVLVIFASTVGAAATLDLLPEAPAQVSVAAVAAAPLVAAPVATVAVQEPELPSSIIIPTLNRTVSVANPISTDIAVLDRALMGGVVRYPTSSELGEDGNVIVFGHSSHLPIVRNQAFKAFNDIETLPKGAEIIVRGATTEYIYAVESVTQASAQADAIPLSLGGQTLTLATCDSFGSTEDRFIVTARLIGTRAIANAASS